MNAPNRIRKAVIPVAGEGKRLRPFTFAVAKAMLPLVDGEDRVRPVLHYILSEAAAAGIDAVALVVAPAREDLLRRYLEEVRGAGYADLPANIEFIPQPQPLGFGHAVLLAGDFVADEPFVLLLGDHVYVADEGAEPCASQAVAAFARTGGKAMVAMRSVGPAELPRVGVARGRPLPGGELRCADFVEKPDLATARSRLVTPGLGEDRFLAHFGIYVFAPVLFDLLSELAAAAKAEGEEIQLAAAQSMLLQRHPDEYYLTRISGQAYDTGTPSGYLRAQAAMRAVTGHGRD